MSEPVTAIICTLNEEQNIRACIESVTGVNEVVIADGGSTDNTREIAESLGARVVLRNDLFDTPTPRDTKKFVERFSWQPSFTPETKIPAGPINVEHVMTLSNSDWIVCPDADERVTWNLPLLRNEVMPHVDHIESEFVHAHTPDGKPVRVTRICKMFKVSKTGSYGRTHNCILPRGVVAFVPSMRIDHWQIPRPNRHSYVLPILEYAVLIDDGHRDRFYLGREYFYHHEFSRAIKLLNLYLKDAPWTYEAGHAHLYKAQALWALQKGPQAREACFQAIQSNPDHKEALAFMAELYYEPWRSKWQHLADCATDKDIMF